MKKNVTKVIIIMLLMCSMVMNVSAQNIEMKTISFFISIYDDIDKTYLLPNTQITVAENISSFELFEVLKDELLISDYVLGNDELISLVLEDEETGAVETVSSTDTNHFYRKHNGYKQGPEFINEMIQSGDIIEWIYTQEQSEVTEVESKQDESTQTIPPARPKTLHWTDQTQKVMTDGCEYLTLNQEKSEYYILALGSAGKTADIKMINQLLSDIRQVEVYETPTAIARTILSLTFCGYDASEWMSEVVNYPELTKDGIDSAIHTLIAYDSKQYNVLDSSVNTRENLVDAILQHQNQSGGFAPQGNAKENVEITAMAITALSPYIAQTDVKIAIEKAVGFLALNQPMGGVDTQKISSQRISKVIVALCSVGVELNDERFIFEEQNLLDNLLQYKNEDGGFSQYGEESSSETSTEQAVIALSAIKKNNNPYYMKRALSPPPSSIVKEAVLLDEVDTSHKEQLILVIILLVLIASICTMLVVIKVVKKCKSV